MAQQHRIVSLMGRLGKDPVEKPTSAGTVTEFPMACTTRYPDTEVAGDTGDTVWFQVAVWNQGLQDGVLATLQKGSLVAVEGAYSETEATKEGYDKFRNIKAFKVGAIELFEKTADVKSTRPAAAPKPAPVSDGLPF